MTAFEEAKAKEPAGCRSYKGKGKDGRGDPTAVKAPIVGLDGSPAAT
jgi:hypothetical protein